MCWIHNRRISILTMKKKNKRPLNLLCIVKRGAWKNKLFWEIVPWPPHCSSSSQYSRPAPYPFPYFFHILRINLPLILSFTLFLVLLFTYSSSIAPHHAYYSPLPRALPYPVSDYAPNPLPPALPYPAPHLVPYYFPKATLYLLLTRFLIFLLLLLTLPLDLLLILLLPSLLLP